MQQWRKNVASILRDSLVETAILSRLRYHDPNPNSWVILDAFQKYFSTKNIDATANFFHLKDQSCLKISREGLLWEPPRNPTPEQIEDAAYSTWYIAQRVGLYRWSLTFLRPFPTEEE